jgi:uncharacterized membrane protein HdeD (DUF308 family)
MKSITSIIGIILIILGIVSLGYQGFSYTQREKVAQIGDLQVTADTQKTVFLPPIVGIAALVAGLVLVVVGRKGDK